MKKYPTNQISRHPLVIPTSLRRNTGLNPKEKFVLAYISNRSKEEGFFIQDQVMAYDLGMTKQKIGRVIRGLIKNGYIVARMVRTYLYDSYTNQYRYGLFRELTLTKKFLKILKTKDSI